MERPRVVVVVRRSRLRRAQYHFHDKRGPYNVTLRGTVWQRCDVVLNFFVARREVLAANPWPEEIKMGDEHYKWFIDLSKNRAFDIAHVPAVTAQHDRTNRSEHYQAFRNRQSGSNLEITFPKRACAA